MALARAFSWVGLAAGLAAVPWALWRATPERHVQRAADVVTAQATPNDLVVVSAQVGDPQPLDTGPLIRPMGALAVLVVKPEGPLPDVTTLPQDRVFVVGPGLDALGAQLRDARDLGHGVVVGVPPGEGTSLVALFPRMPLAVEKDGQRTPCQGRAASTGGRQCGSQPWQNVSPVVFRVQDRLQVCLWAHPFQGATMVMVLPEVTGGEVWMQFNEDALRDAEHPPVTLEAWRADAQVASVSCVNRGEGRCRMVLPDAVKAEPLELRWSTPDAARQVMCLGGRVVTP